MFFRMIKGAIFRQKKKMVLIALVVMLGTCLSTAMLNTMLGIGDKVNRELKAYGANINVVPKESSMLDDIYGIGEDSQKNYLKEDELGLIKTIFWSFNIVDYTPYLNINAKVDGESTRVVGTWFYYHMDLPTGESIDTGMRKLKTWWNIDGEWIEDADTDKVMVGTVFALRNNYKLGDKFEVVVVLKCHNTIVMDKDSEYINHTGNPGMATAGSGDVLAGIIASLLVQGFNTFDAAKYGVYLHGLAGDLAKEKYTEYSLIASDIIEFIPKAIKMMEVK